MQRKRGWESPFPLIRNNLAIYSSLAALFRTLEFISAPEEWCMLHVLVRE
jgi:hypothetical protein